VSAEDTRLLLDLFAAAVNAAQPHREVPPHLPDPPKGRLVVIGCGKASAAMARAVETGYGDDVDLGGLVIVPYGHRVECERIEIVEAQHPVPDENGLEATARILELLAPLGEDDLVLTLVSGGGSALLVQPVPGVTLAEKREVTKALLASGAPISEINLVRTHLSMVKGGGLAAAAGPAQVTTLLVSDVPGDDPAMIASGPTLPPRGTSREALDVLRRRGIVAPSSVLTALYHGTGREAVTTMAWTSGNHRVVAAPQMSLEAAARLAASRGITPVILGDSIEGESREVGRVLAAVARQVALRDQPVPRPCVLLSGGETTVTMHGRGCGGPNSELMLAFALELGGSSAITALACDTDGVDGAAPIAGALVTPDTLVRAEAAGLDPRKALSDNDSHSFFGALGDQVVTGPTLTNVNDFRAVLIR